MTTIFRDVVYPTFGFENDLNVENQSEYLKKLEEWGFKTNPLNKTINLSPEVYEGRSVSAAAVAAHECGHAVQHATQYAFLKMRSALVPIQTFAGKTMTTMIWVLFPLTMIAPSIMPMNMALLIIIFCYGAFTLFSFITLPVEFDASNRCLLYTSPSPRD